MKGPIPEIATCLARADAALTAGEPLACGHHLSVAYQRLEERRHSAPAAQLFRAGIQIMTASLGGWLPALLAHAATVTDDQERWRLYRSANRALACIPRACESVPGSGAEDLATIRAYCDRMTEGIDLAIGAALA